MTCRAGATEWSGATRSFAGLETAPLPPGASRPYLMLAAHGPRTLRLAARYAQAWNTYGGPGASLATAEEYWRAVADQAAGLTAACEAEGRDPGSLRRSLLVGYGEVRPTDSVPAYVEAAERAASLGFDELVVYGPDGPGERFTSDPAVHEQAVGRVKG